MPVRNPAELRAGDFYRQKLSAAYRTGGRVLTIENATYKEPDIWYEIQLDASFAHSIKFARSLIVGRDYTFEAFDASKKNRDNAAIFTRFFKRTKGFSKFLMAISEFAIRGESYGYPNCKWETLDVLGNGHNLRWFIPEEVKHIDRYRLDKIFQDDGSIKFKIYSLKERGMVDMTEEQQNALIYFNNSAEEGRFTYGNPLLEAIHFAWYCKKILESELLNAAERFGQGFLVHTSKELRESSESRELAAIQARILLKLKTAKARHAMSIPEGETLQVLEPSGAGIDILIRGIDYYDNMVRTLCIGANLSVTNVQTGTYAQASVHENTTFLNAEYNRRVIEDAITDSLVRLIWESNEDSFRALGLWEGGQPPRFKILGGKDESPEKWAEILPVAKEMGLDIVETEAYKLLGLTPPLRPDNDEQGDKILGKDDDRDQIGDESGKPSADELGASDSESAPKVEASEAPKAKSKKIDLEKIKQKLRERNIKHPITRTTFI